MTLFSFFISNLRNQAKTAFLKEHVILIKNQVTRWVSLHNWHLVIKEFRYTGSHRMTSRIKPLDDDFEFYREIEEFRFGLYTCPCLFCPLPFLIQSIHPEFSHCLWIYQPPPSQWLHISQIVFMLSLISTVSISLVIIE